MRYEFLSLTVVPQTGCCHKCQQDMWAAASVFMCGTYRLCYWARPARSVSHLRWQMFSKNCT